MEVKKLLRELRGVINLGGGTSVDEALDSGFAATTPRVRRVKVDQKDVMETIQRDIGVSGDERGVTVLPLDSHYWVPEERSYRELLSNYKNEIGDNIYQGDAYDCDNYALDLMNFFQNQCGVNSVGFVYDGDSAHAYNIVVHSTPNADKELRATLLEPNFWSMNGGEVEPTDSDGYYSVQSSTVLI